MGNQPSSTKESGGHNTPRASNSTFNSPRHQSASSSTGPATSTVAAASASSSGSGSASASHSRSTSTRAPISVHNRAVAPAQASLAQAHGSTDITNSSALPITSLAASPVGSTRSGSGVAGAIPRPVEHRRAPVRQISNATEAEPSKPVDVPNPNAASTAGTAANLQPVGDTPISPFDSSDTGLHSHGSVSNMSFISRPPRLPLPIQEEVHTPGSPIIAPADIGEPVESLDFEETLPRKTSNLSSTSTIDDDDTEELRVDKNRPSVKSKLYWTRGGEKVYVTGTIFQWNRKQRLQPVEGRPGVFMTEINIFPGTHHIRFLVDNEMQTSPDLPTTVDFGNNLVNYIEISPDDLPSQENETVTPAPVATPAEDKEQDHGEEKRAEDEEQQPRPYKQLPPPEAFSRVYPQYLQDFEADESEPDGKAKAELAVEAIRKLETPPSLPGFLAKPILNAATLMKDDNSVLNMPNHTTLNHLATSSIKNGTLAVSATTRYRDKYVTTIMYKPVIAPGGLN